jgi:hypothetical protein
LGSRSLKTQRSQIKPTKHSASEWSAQLTKELIERVTMERLNEVGSSR